MTGLGLSSSREGSFEDQLGGADDETTSVEHELLTRFDLERREALENRELGCRFRIAGRENQRRGDQGYEERR